VPEFGKMQSCQAETLLPNTRPAIRSLETTHRDSWNPPAGNPAACGGEEGRSPESENGGLLRIVLICVWVV
jgi:hypothetical protein